MPTGATRGRCGACARATPPPRPARRRLHDDGFVVGFDIEPVDADRDQYQDHLNNTAAVRMFNELRIAYVAAHADAPDWPSASCAAPGSTVVVRELHVRYESEGLDARALRRARPRRAARGQGGRPRAAPRRGGPPVRWPGPGSCSCSSAPTAGHRLAGLVSSTSSPRCRAPRCRPSRRRPACRGGPRPERQCRPGLRRPGSGPQPGEQPVEALEGPLGGRPVALLVDAGPDQLEVEHAAVAGTEHLAEDPLERDVAVAGDEPVRVDSVPTA